MIKELTHDEVKSLMFKGYGYFNFIGGFEVNTKML